MLEACTEALTDSLKLIPFLLITYLVMGILERVASEKSKKIIKEAGAMGPIWGAVLGAFPQCGFSAAASNFYVGRIITTGTLISIYLSTSDEMLPIFISEKVLPSVIFKILAYKIIIGVISGFICEFLLGWISKRRKNSINFDEKQKCCQNCSCRDSMFLDAVIHTFKIFIFILGFSVAISILIYFIGENSLSVLFADIPVIGEMIAAIIGLIPNCAASVVITQLYLDGIIGPGPMMSGLLVSAGVGLLVLFRENRHMGENFTILITLYCVSVIWGSIIEMTGITF